MKPLPTKPLRSNPFPILSNRCLVKDEGGVTHCPGFLVEADPHEILARVIDVISAVQNVAAFQPEGVTAFLDSTRGANALYTMTCSINHALQVARELITEERAGRSVDSNGGAS